ncbi:MAG TPA: hypothetical protein VJB65_04560 [Patescibacteria group bacterium]|nr:hypothetical protein [Patescibacteria group bacterium]
MMNQFNLLPQQYKRSMRRWILFQHLRNGLILFNIALLLISSVQLVIALSLQTIITKTSILSSSSMEDPDVAALTADIQVANKAIQQITSIQSEHPNYLALIKSILTLPSGISIQHVSITYNSEEITLSGIAKNRSTLQELQQYIENDTRFILSSFPYEAFIQSENIPFTIAMQFAKDQFNIYK